MDRLTSLDRDFGKYFVGNLAGDKYSEAHAKRTVNDKIGEPRAQPL